MKKHSRFLFWLIVLLTIFAISIDVPKSFTIAFEFPIPFINKKISIHQKIVSPQIDFFLKPFGVMTDFSFRKGLDLEGGTSITLKADMEGIPKDQRVAALESAKEVIERRVNFFGVSEPVLQTSVGNSEYRIIVELPGITNIDQAVSLVGATAKLEFREVTDATLSAIPTIQDTLPTDLSGADLQDAQVSFDQQTGQPVVLFRVKSLAQEKFYKTTQKLTNKRMAIFLDEQFVSAPTVQSAIRDNGQITGNFTTESAKQLATQLNAGALPVPLTILQQNTIGATLGLDSLRKSLFAGFLGFMVIVVFMSVLYGRLGLIANLALILYTLFVLAIFKLIPVTLTLSGIAGFILSIGMAVDANILIFERMREELRRNRPYNIAMELGFNRAWSSIRDSNIASIITALILVYFGTGIVRGFAVTLLIGVLVSMFSAITITRTFLRLVYR